jgi:hypothetical protein
MLYIILGIVAFIFLFLWWLGLFKKMVIEEKKFPGGIFVYKDYRDAMKYLPRAYDGISKDLYEYMKKEVRKV